MDNIYRQNVYSYGTEMWHKKGLVGTEKETCVSVYSRMTPVTFEKREFEITLNGKPSGSKLFAIVHIQDGKEFIIGDTKDRYQITQPLEYCQLYDEAVGMPCETLGFLGTHGKRMFITSKLPSIDIYGDVIELYQFLSVGFDGLYGEHQYITGVRTICQNTHNMAVADAENTNNHGRGGLYNGRHNQPNHIRDLKSWLSHVQKNSEEMVNITQNLFCKMQEISLDKDTAYGLVKDVYSTPDNLPDFYPEDLREEKQGKIDEKVAKIQESRDLVMELFGGNSIGIAIDPTCFGLYNSFTQVNNHHIPSKKDFAYSVLLGKRNDVMSKALNVIGGYAKSQ